MFGIVLCLVISFLSLGACFVKIMPTEDNMIITSEARVRDTFISLMESLHALPLIEADMQRYFSIHNHLLGITLQSYDVMKEIVKITHSSDSNVTEVLIDEFNIENETFYDETIRGTIREFLKELDYYRSVNGRDIVLEAFINNEVVANNTDYDDVESSEGEGVGTSEFWVPTVDVLKNRRIYQGESARIKLFPFLAVVLVFKQFYCAGSIISPDLIITAASCLQLAWNNLVFRDNPTFLTVRVGSSYYATGGDIVNVKKIHFHPDFNPHTLKNNICLLRLYNYLDLNSENKKIKKVDFDRKNETLSARGNEVTIVGWGAKNHASTLPTVVEVLSYDQLDVYTLKDCQDIYSKDFVTDHNFCAGFVNKGGGACNHDVGAPGVVNGVLTGIVTFGSPICGTPDAPTVFTKIGFYSEWIESIINTVPTLRKSKSTTQQTSYFTYELKINNKKSLKKSSGGNTQNDDDMYLSFVKTLQAKDLMEVFNAKYKNSSEESAESDSSQRMLDKDMEQKRKQVIRLLKDMAQNSKRMSKHKHHTNHKVSNRKEKTKTTTKRPSLDVVKEMASSSGSNEFRDLLNGKLLGSHTHKHPHIYQKSKDTIVKTNRVSKRIDKAEEKYKFNYFVKKAKNSPSTNKTNAPADVEHDILTKEIKNWIKDSITIIKDESTTIKSTSTYKVVKPKQRGKSYKTRNADQSYSDPSDAEDSATIADSDEEQETRGKKGLSIPLLSINTMNMEKSIPVDQGKPVSFDYYEKFFATKNTSENTSTHTSVQTSENTSENPNNIKNNQQNNRTYYDELEIKDDSSDYYQYFKPQNSRDPSRSTKSLRLLYADNFDTFIKYFHKNQSDSAKLGNFVQSIYYKGGDLNSKKTVFRASAPSTNDTELSLYLTIKDKEDSRRNKGTNEISRSLVAKAFRNWINENSANSASQDAIAQKTDKELFNLLKIAIKGIKEDLNQENMQN